MEHDMEQRSDEWFEARKGKVTASMVGAILGLNPYMNREDAMRAMVRDALGEEREFKGNVATEYGKHNEDGALVEYRMETMHDVEVVGFITHAMEDWAGCSPDGLIGDKGGVEIKCPYSLRNVEGDPVFKMLHEQPHYEAQVQFSLWVTGRQWWSFYQWAPKGTHHRVVRPDPDWVADNIPRLRQFHAEFLDELKNNADEYRAPRRVAVDTPEAAKAMAEWDDIAEQMERLAERKKDLLASITDMAGGKDAMVAGRKVTLVSREGSVSYAKVVKDHAPGVDLEPYRGKPSSYWKVS